MKQGMFARLKWAGLTIYWLSVAALAQTPTATVDPTSVLVPHPATSLGQSATQLPDGRWLLLGGQSDSSIASFDAALLDAKSGKSTPLSTRLVQARTGHSATLLPDGSILVLGGQDAKGQIVTVAEQFDPASASFKSLGELGLIARSGHTATVLTDGRLLITGGSDAHGRAIYDAELYNLATHQSEHFNVKLDTARFSHLAALLPSSGVLIWGGVDNAKQALSNGELYDPASQRFTSVSSQGAAELAQILVGAGVPGIKDSQPVNNAQAAAVDQAIVIRFTQRMSVATFNDTNVTLLGPNGAVAIKSVPVEYGLLLFITPLQDLLPASRYTLFVDGATDTAGRRLPFTAIGFTTAQLGGLPSAAAGNALSPVQVNSAAAEAPSAAPQNAVKTALTVSEQQKVLAAEAGKDAEEWIPNENHRHGNWRTGRDRSPLQGLPPLSAPAGVTALAGQVLTMHGRALANVTLTIGGQAVKSDATGRFLISGLAAGAQTLNIDATTANHNDVQYGFYQVLTPVQAGKTNVLNYTIWMTRLDSLGNVTIPAPTLQETILTAPRIPGLELHIPAGTVIRGRDGKIVTQLNMTAIPIDRPPFPLPQIGVPVYFTIQPGGSVIQSTKGQVAQGARLIYPNFSKEQPGTRMSFWNYDAQGKGWYVYGQGTVSKDGKQVIPDPGVVIYEFTGAMVSLPTNAPPLGPSNICGSGGASLAGDPVDCGTGLFLNEETDLVVEDVIPLVLGRSYRPQDNQSRGFGIGTNLSYDFFIVGTSNVTSSSGGAYTYMDLILPNGTHIHYPRISAGTGYSNAVFQNTETPGKYYGSILSGSGTWTLTLKDGTVYNFGDSDGSANPRLAAVQTITDRYGNKLTLTRQDNYNLTQISSSSGRYIQFTYDTSNRIVQAIDNLNRIVSYSYDAGGRLSTVTDPNNNVEHFTYDANNYMLSVIDKRGNAKVVNTYDTNGRVSTQTYPDNSTSSFAYTLLDNAATQGQLAVCAGQATTLPGPVGSYPMACTVGPGGMVTQTDVTDERGNVKRIAFDGMGNPISVTKAFGKPEAQTFTYQRDPSTSLVTSMTDSLGRQTAYTYDNLGNVLTVTQLAGTANAVTTTFTYTSTYNQMASIKDVLNHTTNFGYDPKGNLLQVTDANNNPTSRGYNTAGLMTSLTNALGKVTSFTYDVGDLVQITDALNRSINFSTDAVGRTIAVTDPLGNRSTASFDNLRLSQTADALSQPTGFSYDANGNLTAVTDAKNNQHQFVIDTRNAVSSSVDPLNKSEAYQYDAGHNLIQKTDRKGQVTQYTYDNLNRLSTVTYADSSSVTFSYDAGNRITQVVDSLNGTISNTYDNLDHLIQTSTVKGSVAYTYYANGLRNTMTVSGQPTVTYTYDAGNRLTRIDQAAGAANNNVAQSVVFSYDVANHRTQTQLANGQTINYSYDDASQLTGITYKNSDNSTAGNLSYAYDNAGRRIRTSGSFARTNLSANSSNTGIDAANRLTVSNGQSLSYDLNGNLISDGVNTYTWNARNQLTQISGAVTASFSYDALGRRQTRTLNGVGSGYVYDGLNLIQELNGTGVDNSNPANLRASYLTGLGIDEVLAQQTGTGTSAQTINYFSDALGSTIRLTDQTGNKLVDYTYDPYGNTTADATIANPFQYTGRENDGTGFYFYRARYYSPTLQRFISEDQIGLAGGINQYGYVNGNPISYRDPFGLDKQYSIGGSATAFIPIPPLFAPSIGISASLNVGISTDGTFAGTQVFSQAQGNVMIGLGAFGGAGGAVSYGTTSCSLTPGFSTSGSGYWEADAGMGDAIGYGRNFDYSSKDSGNSFSPPKVLPGVGYGVAAGIGASGSITLATPTFGSWFSH
ncbi:RHS repeat-associated core domain-containing protein [Collimonas sp. OK307]|uniref:RHS repeat-associated core domain-containing protein n=1 Tax=Collimonas sp. OK307 TaxID=1801620 RepID=UPI0008F1629E|nr:RHS repeat-associated core domain-containing protein [Collimonas sp. OK307]SFI48553.1 RHS repeat-associated core domain-containing protein [Collimonas sp. OK307]